MIISCLYTTNVLHLEKLLIYLFTYFHSLLVYLLTQCSYLLILSYLLTYLLTFFTYLLTFSYLFTYLSHPGRVCSAHFCHLNHLCHSSPVLSIHINGFCQPHHFCQLLSPQGSPVLTTISTTYVAKDDVTKPTLANKARPLLSTVIL